MGKPFFERRYLDKERAIELYNIGYCDRQIADECGVNVDAVRCWRRRMGLVAHKVRYVKPEQRHKPTIVELEAEARKHGMSYGEYTTARRVGKL